MSSAFQSYKKGIQQAKLVYGVNQVGTHGYLPRFQHEQQQRSAALCTAGRPPLVLQTAYAVV
jgi:hypothetical protein